MPTLSKELRRTLENVVADARRIAEAGAEQALKQLAVHHSESWPAMTTEEKALREKLRAHGKQLGDKREANRTQEIPRLKQACAYEHWHRMLFARFLAENNLLIHPEYGEPLSIDEVRELAREQNADWLSIAASFAQRMLLEVFRADDPVLDLVLPPETRQKLEEKLGALPTQIFTAEDSLGWVYQFWQRDEKDAVNKSEVKIGADEISPVTQLFTEDYMVLFLLHNTLGAWWTAKHRAEGKDPGLSGYEWKYLRLTDDGTPAAGSYDGWPRAARYLRLLDPCMGSGHFLTFALPILTRMRMEEESLSLPDATAAVLRDNLFGLELDARCSQIAAFNLALTAWRLMGEHNALPTLNLACSGLGINAPEADWGKLAGADGRQRDWMERLYALFRQAPTLGSLIDPLRIGGPVFADEFRAVSPLLEQALQSEETTKDATELAIAARGLLSAARILASEFTLVATNVPYLGRGGQSDVLKAYCDEHHSDARSDLATCMFDRCIRFCAQGGTTALVTLQSWLFMGPYKDFRSRLLKHTEWNFVARLGARAFETISGEIVNVALSAVSRRHPNREHTIAAIDAVPAQSPSEKDVLLRSAQALQLRQEDQLRNPDARFVIGSTEVQTLLRDFADCYKGIATGDLPRFIHQFWEIPAVVESGWECFQGAVRQSAHYGARDEVILWEKGRGSLYRYVAERLGVSGVGAWIRGEPAWGKRGVAVAQMSSLACSLYTGDLFDENTGAIIPKNPKHLAAIWAFCSSSQYAESIRAIDHSLKVPTLTLLKVPFDLEHWIEVGSQLYPNGLPTPATNDCTQWLFNGCPIVCDNPLQVAVARLLGFRWPRQTGTVFPNCPALEPDGLEAYAASDGIVCMSSVAGEPPAADRLRALLARAFGSKWSAAKLAELLGGTDSLESWLQDVFFEKHCEIFQNRPFVWHIWDGRKDGFHALVNYHELAAPNGEGRKTLEKLIYTALGDWISRQRAEVAAGVDGADARLTAAQHLQSELEKILAGEDPYDVFVRWKPLHEQPVGWEPDLNDGVRLNIRPWLTATLAPHTKPKKGACILRVTPKIAYGKDRGKEPSRDKTDFPWFADSTDRDNDIHLGLDEKRKARERRKK